MPDKQPNVFLSYSHHDRKTVKEIRRILIDNDIPTKWDPDFRIGDRWEEQMKESLREADCVVVCWSQNSADSDMVYHEYAIADYDKKHVGIALEPRIDFKGIGGAPHHERYYEWDDDNRDERIKVLTDLIKEMASFRNPAVSMDEILSVVRRVDRKPQANIVQKSLTSRLSAKNPGCIWLLSAHHSEWPEQFAIRAANQLIPEMLKTKGIISDANDENYELEFYKLDWPEGYRNVEEAVEYIIEKLKAKVPGYVDEDLNVLEACILATDTIAPAIYIELPLDVWRPDDQAVLEKLLQCFGEVNFDPAQPKYLAVLVAADFADPKNKMVSQPSSGIFGRFFTAEEDIDEVFTSLADKNRWVEAMPTLKKITRKHMSDWYDEVDEAFTIPEEHRNYFRKKINSTYDKNDSTEEHYEVLADPMQQALERVFRGKKNNQSK